MKLSVVATLFHSAPYIREFVSRVTDAARQVAGEDYEIVLVNDGSPDNSLEIAIELVGNDSHVIVVDLSRNFGHHKAIMTGLANSGGELVYLIDSDLEEEPEWLLSFWTQLDNEKCDVVYGVQQRRKGGVFERWSGECFYYLFRNLTGLPLQENIVTARLMTRRYVDSLVSHQEREIFLAGLWHITGFLQKGQTVKKHSSSATTYTFARKLSLLINSVTSFSNVPLIAIFYLGSFISFVSAASVVCLVLNRIVFSTPLSGWTSVMASLWLLGGVLIASIGVVGVYLSKIFTETKRRPYTIVRNVYGRK
jgi:putative glycosyltransferase